jgi:hypothetical protein
LFGVGTSSRYVERRKRLLKMAREYKQAVKDIDGWEAKLEEARP